MSVIEREATESPTVGESGCLVRPVTTSDVLHRAADLLEEFGWCQGSYGENADGEPWTNVREAVRFCAVGAIDRALYDFGQGTGSWQEIVNSVHTKVARWNDEPGRTKEQVVARLREAADA